jgi:hypothetical protein
MLVSGSSQGNHLSAYHPGSEVDDVNKFYNSTALDLIQEVSAKAGVSQSIELTKLQAEAVEVANTTATQTVKGLSSKDIRDLCKEKVHGLLNASIMKLMFAIDLIDKRVNLQYDSDQEEQVGEVVERVQEVLNGDRPAADIQNDLQRTLDDLTTKLASAIK